MGAMERFVRKSLCAVLPRRTTLTRKLTDEIEPEFANLSAFLGRDGVLIDVGANTGIYSMKGARIGDGALSSA